MVFLWILIVPASKRYAGSKDKSWISLSFTIKWRSPLLHLQRRGCREMERCIGRQSSLERSKAPFRLKIKTIRRFLHSSLQPLVHPAFTISIARKSMEQFIYYSQHRNKKNPITTYTTTVHLKSCAYWKTPCTPGCLACLSPPYWSSCLLLSNSSSAVCALIQEDWEARQSLRQQEHACVLLKLRDRHHTWQVHACDMGCCLKCARARWQSHGGSSVFLHGLNTVGICS